MESDCNTFLLIKLEKGSVKLITDKKEVRESDDYVIQQYVNNPHLMDGLRYELKVYVLITCVHPLTIFMYQDAIANSTQVAY